MYMDREWYCCGEKLIRQIRSCRPAPDQVAFWYIGQCGIVVKYGNCIILVDPVLTEVNGVDGKSRKHYPAPFSPESDFPADYILCTHDHLDHLNLDTLTAVHKTHPTVKFIVPQPFCEKLSAAGIAAMQLIGAVQGKEIQLTGLDLGSLEVPHFSVLPFAVPHDTYAWDKNGNSLALGYLICCGNLSLFHGGDLVAADPLISELQRQKQKIDVAFLPINGRDWLRERCNIIGNLNPLEAAHFADQINADLVIPTHFDMMVGNEEDPLIFAHYMELYYPLRRYHIMKLGEGYLTGIY